MSEEMDAGAETGIETANGATEAVEAPAAPDFIRGGFSDAESQARGYAAFIDRFGGEDGFRSHLSRIEAYEAAQAEAERRERMKPPAPAAPAKPSWWREEVDWNDPDAARGYAGRAIQDLPNILDEHTKKYDEKLEKLERMTDPIYQHLPPEVIQDLEEGNVTWKWVKERWFPTVQRQRQAYQQRQQQQAELERQKKAREANVEELKAKEAGRAANGQFATTTTTRAKPGATKDGELRDMSFDQIYERNAKKAKGK